MKHRYTRAPLPRGHATFVAGTPGVRDVVRLFPEPAAGDHGSLTVEGGITLVAGPKMGRTTLLVQVGHALERERNIPCAHVEVPVAAAGEDFHDFLGALAAEVRTALLRSASLADAEHAQLRAALVALPESDVPGRPSALTPRGLQRWIGALGRAAGQGRGCCVLIDGLDHVARCDWSPALISGLRFVFQAAGSVTPIFALWDLYFEESLPGSNYFRNVTRPLFVGPFSGLSEPGSERARLIDVDLAALSLPARVVVSDLVGGHPALLQSALAALADELPSDQVRALDADAIRERLATALPALRTEAVAILGRVPQIAPALRRIARGDIAWTAVPRALLTTGLVDRTVSGAAVLPGVVASALATR